jgi:hypothetical protein
VKPDVYGEQIERVLLDAAETGEGIGYLEIARAVGCQRARVFQWLKRNEDKWTISGLDQNGGRLFMATKTVNESWMVSNGREGGRDGKDGKDGRVNVTIDRGDTLIVEDVRVSKGATIVVVVNGRGERMELKL